ncbi:hypothetical protein Tco_0341524 [Tanacetum coccineum]
MRNSHHHVTTQPQLLQKESNLLQYPILCNLLSPGKKEDIGLDELGEGGKGVVSKIREFSGDLGGELLGDRGGEDDERGFIVIREVGGVLFGRGEGDDGARV